jgi:hypothetical protein
MKYLFIRIKGHLIGIKGAFNRPLFKFPGQFSAGFPVISR